MARIWPFKFGSRMARPARRRIAGGLVDRARPISFHYNGRTLTGFAGDTLASALLANAVDVPKDPVVITHAKRVPVTVQASSQELYDGLSARSAGPWRARLSPLLRRFRQVEPAEKPDLGRIEHVYEHVDLLVIGSGPMGLSAALEAAEKGADVLLVEKDFMLGGGLLYDDAEIAGLSPRDWREQVLTHLKAAPNVCLLTRTEAYAIGDGQVQCRSRLQDHLAAPNRYLDDTRIYHIEAAKIHAAPGEADQPFSFKNNDLPGVFGIQEARRVVCRHAVRPGETILFHTAEAAGYELAASFLARGIKLAAIVDARDDVPSACHQFARRAGIPLYPGHQIVSARGITRLRGVILRKSGTDPLNRDIQLVGDCLIQSAGVAPRALHEGEAVPPETLPHLRQSPLRIAFEKAEAAIKVKDGWERAAAYPGPKESLAAAVKREALAVRRGVGMSDISPLGKIDIQGPDAAAFMAQCFGPDGAIVNPGKLRAGYLAREDGTLIANAMIWRRGPSHFLVTTAPAVQEAVLAQLTAFAKDAGAARLRLTDVTDAWGGVALAGPSSEALLASALPMSVMAEDLPPMAFREITQDDLPLSLARLSLAGGAGYEILTPAGYTDLLWTLILDKGRAHNLTLVGTMAREISRIEAGRPGAAELKGGIIAAKLQDALVGLKPVSDPAEEKKATPRLKAGMILYEGDGTEPTGAGIGRITSASASPALGHDIALALLKEGRARHGTLIRAVGDSGKTVIEIKVGAPRAVGPEGEAHHA